jgi:tRNA(Ile)-lysidine synthase TilS/MesJ
LAQQYLIVFSDIKTYILSLDWSKYTSGKRQKSSKKPEASIPMPSAFETHARRLRFQALGSACQRFRIGTLLLGHHQDDNVETTIWRLSSGARGLGLGGIPEVARIPECHGLYGISESGSILSMPLKPENIPETKIRFIGRSQGEITFPNPSPEPENGKHSYHLSPSTSYIASGGIFLCRPLLSFPKTSLVETCRKNQVPYVSDPTNFDPTLTPRNAIRSLVSSNSLPRALQSQSILSLIRSSQNLLEDSKELSNSLLASQCRLLDFNPRAGSAVIQFLNPNLESIDPQIASLSNFQARQIQTLVLRRITELISPFPDNHFALRSYEPMVSRVFSGSDSDVPRENTTCNNDARQKQAFTLGGVIFQPLANDEGHNIWLLSRQPFMKGRDPVKRLYVPPRGEFTPWSLWDNRYWLRFSLTPKNPTLDPRALSKLENISIRLRPFQQTDMQMMRKEAEGTGPKSERIVDTVKLNFWEETRALLAAEAPASMRFTLPLLEKVESNGSREHPVDQMTAERLAFPTLDCRLQSYEAEYDSRKEVELVHYGKHWKLKWQWMYKRIDTEALRLMGWPLEDTEDA